MSKALQVVLAVKAMVAAAVPAATVLGFDGDSSVPEVIPRNGLVIGAWGDPGEPEITLNPPTYDYQHAIKVRVGAPDGAGGALLDAMLVPIGAAVVADPFLGGRCDYLEVQAPDRYDSTEDDVTVNWAELSIVAHYSTTNPLG